jgi:hypothetical protein
MAQRYKARPQGEGRGAARKRAEGRGSAEQPEQLGEGAPAEEAAFGRRRGNRAAVDGRVVNGVRAEASAVAGTIARRVKVVADDPDQVAPGHDQRHDEAKAIDDEEARLREGEGEDG